MGLSWKEGRLIRQTLLRQVMVAGMRVRVRLDQARLAEMLRGLDAARLGGAHADTVAGLLACLGDLATVSFQPHLSGRHGE